MHFLKVGACAYASPPCPSYVLLLRSNKVEELQTQVEAANTQAAKAEMQLMAAAQQEPPPSSGMTAEEAEQLRGAVAAAEEEAAQLRTRLSVAEEEVLRQTEACAAQAACQEAQAAAQAGEIAALGAKGAELASVREELESVQHKLCAAVKKGKRSGLNKFGLALQLALLSTTWAGSGLGPQPPHFWPLLEHRQLIGGGDMSLRSTLLRSRMQGIERDKAAVVLERDALLQQLQLRLDGEGQRADAVAEQLQQQLAAEATQHAQAMQQQAERLLEVEKEVLVLQEALAGKVGPEPEAAAQAYQHSCPCTFNTLGVIGMHASISHMSSVVRCRAASCSIPAIRSDATPSIT
eukprot:311541-Pelagomonas_calceolata.AAC.2